MDVEKTLDFSVEAVEDEQDDQNINIVQRSCWGTIGDADYKC